MSSHAPKLRLTSQRRHVYDELMSAGDHPTATDVFIRVQKKLSSISLATVYNCLETMVDHGLIKAVHVDREPTRFCANLKGKEAESMAKSDDVVTLEFLQTFADAWNRHDLDTLMKCMAE